MFPYIQSMSIIINTDNFFIQLYTDNYSTLIISFLVRRVYTFRVVMWFSPTRPGFKSRRGNLLQHSARGVVWVFTRIVWNKSAIPTLVNRASSETQWYSITNPLTAGRVLAALKKCASGGIRTHDNKDDRTNVVPEITLFLFVVDIAGDSGFEPSTGIFCVFVWFWLFVKLRKKYSGQDWILLVNQTYRFVRWRGCSSNGGTHA